MRPIDADKLKNIVRGLPMDGTITMLGAKNVIHVIDNMPTVTPIKHRHRIAHKHGHWILDKHRFIFACSKCGDTVMVKSNYCPYCGAKMDEVTE